MENNKYILPNLNYGYKDLEPYISEEQLKIHHQKHHQAYVDGANNILEEGNPNPRKLSFQLGGYKLHSLFWANLSPAKEGKNTPQKETEKLISENFGSLENFKEEFTKVAMSVEGSGWAVLVYDKEIQKPIIMQIEKHNLNIYPTLEILLVLDMFEHAYYIDYKNEKSKYISAFWNIIKWAEIEERYEKLK
ncbi:MAG: superoxide dismutase [Candidatus Marinimicrobia bacterium]|nr:superoxide dismutase [Candidatus Neomarinimicrobiota bacterium]